MISAGTAITGWLSLRSDVMLRNLDLANLRQRTAPLCRESNAAETFGEKFVGIQRGNIC